MINIDLGKGYRIISDKLQFIIQKSYKSGWSNIYYHGEIEPLLHSVALLRVRVGNATSLSGLINDYRKEKDALIRAIRAKRGKI